MSGSQTNPHDALPMVIAEPGGRTAATATSAGADLEHEIKFRLPRRCLAPLRTGLDALCRRDPRHPSNVVASIYYDTRRWRSLQEKLDSDRFKVKVRLRWYEGPDSPAELSPAFLEVKFRLGTRRKKIRLQVPAQERHLSALRLEHPALLALPKLLRSSAFVPPADLSPLLVVRYRRDRYLDPPSGTRISLDREISVPRVNPRFLPPVTAPPLDHAVLEIKNRSGILPQHLRPLLGLGARMSSFSKYGACFQVVLASHGLRG